MATITHVFACLQPPPFRFFDLPKAIRERIYKAVFYGAAAFYYRYASQIIKGRKYPRGCGAYFLHKNSTRRNILMVCQFCYQEGIEIWRQSVSLSLNTGEFNLARIADPIWLLLGNVRQIELLDGALLKNVLDFKLHAPQLQEIRVPKVSAYASAKHGPAIWDLWFRLRCAEEPWKYVPGLNSDLTSKRIYTARETQEKVGKLRVLGQVHVHIECSRCGIGCI